jgi:hypothetical protein
VQAVGAEIVSASFPFGLVIQCHKLRSSAFFLPKGRSHGRKAEKLQIVTSMTRDTLWLALSRYNTCTIFDMLVNAAAASPLCAYEAVKRAAGTRHRSRSKESVGCPPTLSSTGHMLLQADKEDLVCSIAADSRIEGKSDCLLPLRLRS